MKKHSLRVLSAVLTLLMLASVFTGFSVSAAGITFTVQNVTIGGCLYPVPNADPYAMKSTIYGNAGDEGADVVDFWWFNETAGARVPDNGNVKFQSNNVYTLNVVIKAVELDEDSNSYTFPNSFKSTRFWFSNNNNERGNATATQYEDKPLNQYRLLSWTSISLPEIKITELRLEGVKTVLNPDTEGLIAGKPVSDLTASAGNLVDSEGVPIAGGEPNYTVHGYQTYVLDESEGELVEVTDPDAVFEVGKTYYFSVTLIANDPYYFSTNASGKPNVDAIWAYGPTSALTMTNNKIATTTNTNDTLTLTYQFPKVSAVKIPVTSPYATFYTTPHYFDKIDYAALAPSVSEGFVVDSVKVFGYDAEQNYVQVEDGSYIGNAESIYDDIDLYGLHNIKAPRYHVKAILKLGDGYSLSDEEYFKFKVYGGYDVSELGTEGGEKTYYTLNRAESIYMIDYYFTAELDPDMAYGGDVYFKSHNIKGGDDADDAAAALLSDAIVMNCPEGYGSDGTLHSVKILDSEGEVFHQTLVGGETYTLRSEILYPISAKIYEPTSEYDKRNWFINHSSDFYCSNHKVTLGTYTDAYEKTFKKVTIDSKFTVNNNFKAGESCEWKFDSATGTLEIKGTGDMYDYKMLDTKPWDGMKNDIKKIVFEHGIVHIGNYAFNDLPNLEEVEISGMVCSIGNGAFRDCPKLKKVTFDQYCTLETIGSGAFENDSALTEITIPDMVTSIGDHAFENTGLTSVAIPAAVKTIGAGAFQNVKLAEINLPAALTEIGEFAFVGATDTEVTVPESVTSIGAYALGYSSVKQIPGEGDAPSTWEGTPVEGFKIVAQAGTAAYRYATGNNITVERTNLVVKFDNKLEYEIMGETYKYGSVQEKFCAADEEVTIPTQTFTTYDMYTFGGWKIEGEDTIYQGGETYKVTKDVTFKAIWTSSPVVTYDDGNGNKRTDVIPSTGEYTFMRCYFTAPEGKVFAGWKIAETVYQPGDKLSAADSFTATAVWADAVTITFDANGGTGEMAAVTVAKGSEYTLPECGFTAPEGKVFGYWSLRVDGETFGWDADPGCIVDSGFINADATVMAMWYDAVTITFDANGGTGEMAAVKVAEGSEYTLPECGFTAPEGKVFSYWSLRVDGVELWPAEAGRNIDSGFDVTATAIWAGTCTVTFDANGGTGEIPAITVVEGVPFTLPECTFTAPEGKVFEYWSLVADGEVVYEGYAGDDSTVVFADTTAMAMWEDEFYDITTCTVEGIKNKAYTGKNITFKLSVKNGSTALTAADYDVAYTNNKAVGTATVTITGKGKYAGTIKKTFKITKAANKMKVTASKKAKVVKFAKVKKKNQTVNGAITIKSAKGKVSCKITSVPKKFKKFVKISSKGVFTVKKGAKKGKYTLKVKVYAKGDKSFKSASKTVKVIIQVK